jgi:hypothetical protein
LEVTIGNLWGQVAHKQSGHSALLDGPLGYQADVHSPAAAWLPGIRLGLELDLLTLIQFIEGGFLYGAAVEEDLLRGALRLNEAKPSIADDTLYGTHGHDTQLLIGLDGLSEGRRPAGGFPYLAGWRPLLGCALLARFRIRRSALARSSRRISDFEMKCLLFFASRRMPDL